MGQSFKQEINVMLSTGCEEDFFYNQGVISNIPQKGGGERERERGGILLGEAPSSAGWAVITNSRRTRRED